MTVAAGRTRVAGFAFDVAAHRHRHRDLIAVRREEVGGRRERAHRRARRSGEHVDREIDLDLAAVAEAACLQRRDHAVAGRGLARL
jgi:hypothetical protein